MQPQTRGNPFSASGNWYRGSSHNHSLASDGKHTVPDLAKWYEDQEMDFIVITDHDVVADVSDNGGGDILVIPGAEVGVCWDEALGAEILCLGIEEIKRKRVHPQDVIYDALEQGGLPYVSHPHLSGVYSALMTDLDGLVGIEVYNHAASVVWNRGTASIHLDDLMGVGKIVWGLASDDLHTIRKIGPQGRVEVRAKSNNRQDILSSMRDGLYYSTTGPQIHDISIGETHVRVKCSAAKRVVFSTLPWVSKKVESDGTESLTEVEVALEQIGSSGRVQALMQELVQMKALSQPKDLRPHLRVEIDDGNSGYAWSNPIPLP